MKKGTSFAFIIAGLLVLSLLPIASAYYLPSVRYGVESVINSLINIFEPILFALFGAGADWSGVFLFEKLLFFIILFAIIHLLLGKIDLFKDSKNIQLIIALLIPLIGVRYIELEWMHALLVQYRIFAIVLTAIIPFILYFYFVYNIAGDHGIIRKMGWLIFVGIYAGLWSTSDLSANSDIYFWTFVAGLVCLFGDNTIAKRLDWIERSKSNKLKVAEELAEIIRRIDEVKDHKKHHRISDKDAQNIIKKLESDYKYLSKRYYKDGPTP